MSSFIQFRDEALGNLALHKIPLSAVKFVNLGASMSVDIDQFCKMVEEDSPPHWTVAEVVDHGEWHIPRGFDVVLNDGSWLHYHEVKDPRFSKWQHLKTPARGKKSIKLFAARGSS